MVLQQFDRFFAAVTLAALSLAFAPEASAQRMSHPVVRQPQFPTQLPETNDAKATRSEDIQSQLSAPDRKIHDQSLKTVSIETPEDCTTIIDAIQQGIDEGASSRYAAYGRTLKAWTHNRRGELLVKEGKEVEALKDFETAVVLNPLLWKAVQNRGVSRGLMGDKAAAMVDFNRVIELNPQYANAWFNRANLKLEQNDFAGALQDFSQAIRLQPADAAFYQSRGQVLYKLGRARQAIADLSRAVQLNPNDAATLVDRGDIYRQGTGQFDLAASDYMAAYRIDPKLGRAYLSAAWQMATCPQARYRNPEKAIEIAKIAIELDGEPDYRYPDTLAAACANAGQFTEAKAAATRAVAAAPEKVRSKVEQRLKIYQRNQAYREGGPAETVRAATRTK
ncbi:MAG: tetratricopeptide repeat protein [Pirellulales bacterium]|nr:tetratricopeptide repeat protein [Pirellulales bacterium]